MGIFSVSTSIPSSLQAAATMYPIYTVNKASVHACMSSLDFFAADRCLMSEKSWPKVPWSRELSLNNTFHVNCIVIVQLLPALLTIVHECVNVQSSHNTVCNYLQSESTLECANPPLLALTSPTSPAGVSESMTCLCTHFCLSQVTISCQKNYRQGKTEVGAWFHAYLYCKFHFYGEHQ